MHITPLKLIRSWRQLSVGIYASASRRFCGLDL